MRVLVIAHVFYPQFWPELASCIRNITEQRDIVVTFVDEASVVEARRDFPEAKFLKCENRGFDIWPFICALRTVDLGGYDAVVKLHTKRDIVKDHDWSFNNCRFNGPVWRNHLLSFCRTHEAWARTVRRLSEPGVGMVADRHVVVRRRDFPWKAVRECFDAAVAEIRAVDGCTPFDERSAQYVSGTMFAARPEPLMFFLKHDFDAGMFEVSGHAAGAEPVLYVHCVENILGLSVSAVGRRIVAWNGSLRWRRIYAPLLHWAFRVKETRNRRMVRILGVPVFWRTKNLV